MGTYYAGLVANLAGAIADTLRDDLTDEQWGALVESLQANRLADIPDSEGVTNRAFLRSRGRGFQSHRTWDCSLVGAAWSQFRKAWAVPEA